MSRASLVFVSFVFVSLGSIARAQQAPLSGPVEGFVYDAPTGSIRGVLGSLGSASLGPAIVPLLDFASVAPRQSYALAVRRGQTLLISGLGSVGLASTDPSLTALAGSFSVPDGIVWSGDGSVAVLYSRTGNWIQAITGLPDSVAAGPLLSLVPLGGSLSAVATDLHGARIAIGITGDHSGVYGLVGGRVGSPPWMRLTRLLWLSPMAARYTHWMQPRSRYSRLGYRKRGRLVLLFRPGLSL